MIGDNFGDFLELAGLIDEFEAEVGNPPCRQERARDDAGKDGDVDISTGDDRNDF